jgi:L-ascorbate metabolism protein UlaG (beta-lactamase superfamily)
MRVHFIGHASLLIEADDVTILMDPIFWDPHYEGTAVMCPAREVTADRLPPYSVIVVSHRHLDHFDIRTLASLDRTCTVLIPAGDGLLAGAIRRLQFSHVQPLEDGQTVTFGRTTLTTTPSKAGVREFGMVLCDSSGTVWNQVDSRISGDIAARVADRHGPIDLLLATWQPLLEGEALTNGTTSFPYNTYFQMLANVQLVRPGAVVPHACGYKYVGDGSWLNKFVFPATRELFARDVSKLATGADTIMANPGDVIELSAKAVTHQAAASPFVRMIRDDVADTWFDPVGAVPELTDNNPRGYNEEHMLRVIERFFTDALAPMLESSRRTGRLAYEYARVGLVYQLDVVFPSGPRMYHVDFAAGSALRDGPSPSAQLRARIAASVLVDLINGDTSASYVYSVGGYRWCSRVYAVAPHGLYRWKPASEPDVTDPLWMAFDLEELFKRYVDRDIALYGGAAQTAAAS